MAAPCALLDKLPRGLRDEIYGYVSIDIRWLSTCDVGDAELDPAGDPAQRPASVAVKDALQTSVFLLDRQIHDEYLEIMSPRTYLVATIFSLRSPPLIAKWTERAPAASLKRIRGALVTFNWRLAVHEIADGPELVKTVMRLSKEDLQRQQESPGKETLTRMLCSRVRASLGELRATLADEVAVRLSVDLGSMFDPSTVEEAMEANNMNIMPILEKVNTLMLHPPNILDMAAVPGLSGLAPGKLRIDFVLTSMPLYMPLSGTNQDEEVPFTRWVLEIWGGEPNYHGFWPKFVGVRDR